MGNDIIIISWLTKDDQRKDDHVALLQLFCVAIFNNFKI